MDEEQFINFMTEQLHFPDAEQFVLFWETLEDPAKLQLAQAFMKAQQEGDYSDIEAIAQLLLPNEYNESMEDITYAKFGAKLDYINSLRGKCPEGYEIESYKAGGCVKCKKTKTPKFEEGHLVKKRFKETTIANDPDFVHKKRKWSDGTTSEMISDEAGTVYKGRRGEVGITNVPNDRQNAIADSLRRADWQRTSNSRPKKVTKGFDGLKTRQNGAKTIKTEITYPTRLESQSRYVQTFDDGTLAVMNGGWGTDGGYRAFFRGRQGEFGNTKGTPKQKMIADSLYNIDWGGKWDVGAQHTVPLLPISKKRLLKEK